MKVAINDGIGGFYINETAFRKMIEYGYVDEIWKKMFGSIEAGVEWEINVCDGHIYIIDDKKRANPILIRVLEELGLENCSNAKLKIIEIPDNIEWYIDECDDGTEFIHKKHRQWW